MRGKRFVQRYWKPEYVYPIHSVRVSLPIVVEIPALRPYRQGSIKQENGGS